MTTSLDKFNPPYFVGTFISIGDYDMVPCGGIHVKSLGELDQVEVTRIKHKKGNTVVSYTFN